MSNRASRQIRDVLRCPAACLAPTPAATPGFVTFLPATAHDLFWVTPGDGAGPPAHTYATPFCCPSARLPARLPPPPPCGTLT